MAGTRGYGQDVMKSRRRERAEMLLLGITLFLCVPPVLAVAAGPPILGVVVASGNASMKPGFDQWLPVDGKTHPVIDGTALKTEEGGMSVTTKDGASFEMGKRTDLILNGAPGNYSMRLNLGTVAFKLYKGTGLSVITPSASAMVQAVSGAVEKSRHPFEDEISGIITHDGKYTQVICLKGKFTVTRANTETQTLTEGNRVTAESLQTFTQTGGPMAIGSYTPGSSLGAAKAYENPAKTPEFLQQANAGGPEVPVILQQATTGGLEVTSENTP